jgi:hypothetical protein
MGDVCVNQSSEGKPRLIHFSSWTFCGELCKGIRNRNTYRTYNIRCGLSIGQRLAPCSGSQPTELAWRQALATTGGHAMSSRRIANVPARPAILVCYRRAECWGSHCRCGDDGPPPVPARCPSESVKPRSPAEACLLVDQYKHMLIRNFPRPICHRSIFVYCPSSHRIPPPTSLRSISPKGYSTITPNPLTTSPYL